MNLVILAAESSRQVRHFAPVDGHISSTFIFLIKHMLLVSTIVDLLRDVLLANVLVAPDADYFCDYIFAYLAEQKL